MSDIKVEGMYRDYANAIVRHRKYGVDTSMKAENESLEDYVNRLYKFMVYRTIMLTGLTDWSVYKLDDMLREQCPDNVEYREAMMRRYHLMEEQINQLTMAPEDYIADMRLKTYQRHKRKMESLFNGLCKIYLKEGMRKAEVCAMISIYINMVELMHKCYNSALGTLGETVSRNIPKRLSQVLSWARLSQEAAIRMFKEIDVEGIMEKCEGNKKLFEQSQRLAESILSNDELERAVKYANQEYYKANK